MQWFYKLKVNIKGPPSSKLVELEVSKQSFIFFSILPLFDSRRQEEHRFLEWKTYQLGKKHIIGTFMFTFKVTLITYFHQCPDSNKKTNFNIAKFIEFEC